jgi:AraC family transcriptional regulator, regulatory protein of adaptative response / methylated-DNA-[protein]-cysteine methyltransferase
MNDYERMARIIRHLDAHHTEQPRVADLARLAGLSESHFHRRFARWTGVTPKDFLQCLTLGHARALLRNGGSVLDTALEAGLSGPGRLHDLCVTLEAASPGELKAGGRGLTITHGCASTPFGECLVAVTKRGICHLSFIEPGELEGALGILFNEWPNARFIRSDAGAARIVGRIFQRNGAVSREAAPLRLWVAGTAFQLRVWRALLAVPGGALTTYRRLAGAIEQPAAARAVGTAVGANPIALFIPCHRVIRETGAVGGYRWGTGRKRTLIACETAPGRPCCGVGAPGSCLAG